MDDPMEQRPDRPEPEHPNEVIDEASMDSFPASDPPSYSGRPKEGTADERQQVEEEQQRLRERDAESTEPTSAPGAMEGREG